MNGFSLARFESQTNVDITRKAPLFLCKFEVGKLDSQSVDARAQMLKLEKDGKNKIWTRVLKNSFAPLFMGKFQCVVGNPPWINWENLPEEYREMSSSLWSKYGLGVGPNAQQVGLGKRGRDMSMLFTYTCCDRYLADNGLLGFMITQMVFKTGGAAGFRRFKLSQDRMLKVAVVHDMVTLRPFESAANMTSMIILRKGEQTTYPVPYVRWIKQKKGEIGDVTLADAMSVCSQEQLVAIPVDSKDKNSPWITAKPHVVNILNKIKGTSQYKAHAGVYTGGANGVYWVKILEKKPSNLLVIENRHDLGKKDLKKTVTEVEVDLVYRLVRSGDIEKWKYRSENYVIVPHTKATSWRAIDESTMKSNFPRTYSYLDGFREFLRNRPDYLLRRKRYPFYIMFNAHRISFMPYKVVWKRMASKMEAVVLHPIDDRDIGRKVPILQETLSYIPLKVENEAHFLCAILNAVEINALVRSFSQMGGKSFATPSILDQVRIPRYDPSDKTHRKLAELSKEAHSLASKSMLTELEKTEIEIGKCVAELYQLSDREVEKLEAEV